MALVPLNRSNPFEVGLVGRWFPRRSLFNAVANDRTPGVLEGNTKNTITDGIQIGTTVPGGYWVGDRILDIPNANTPVSLSFWARANTTSNSDAVLCSWVDDFDSNQMRMNWRLTSQNQIQAIAAGSGNAGLTPSLTDTITDWNHFVITVDETGTQEIAVNGSYDWVPGVVPFANGQDTKFTFGGWYFTAAQNFNGNIDNMALWHRRLSRSEVCQLAAFGRAVDFLDRPKIYVPFSAGPVIPERDGDGLLVQSAQQISGSGTVVGPPTRTGTGDLVQSDQLIAGVGEHAAVIDGDGQLIQTAQEISSTGVIISPGTKTGGAALIQTDQVIAGVGTKVSAPRMGVGALIQSQQVIVGRGFGEGFTQPVTDQVYTLADVNVYTINDAYVYT